jgi:lactoylglutathione lyase
MRTLHVGLRVEDLERSLRFYTTIGYEVVGTVPQTEFGTLTMLQLPGDEFVSVELVHDPSAGPVHPAGLNHLVVQVDDLHSTVDRLAAQGLPVDVPRSPDGAGDLWTTWLTDPDGYRIELVQWPAGHADGLTRADFPGQAPPSPTPPSPGTR